MINDCSPCTSRTAAARRALAAYESPLRVILGGSLKGEDFSVLADDVHENVRAAYLIGEATDELELHASLRALQHYDGWRIDARAGDTPVATNPWSLATLGRTTQWLVGASWTGQQQQSVLVEWWHDGTTLTDYSPDEIARQHSINLALDGRQVGAIPLLIKHVAMPGPKPPAAND